MHDIIKFLKGAVGKTSGLAYYVFADGLVTARSEGLQAGIALDSPMQAAVPADELDAVLARIDTVKALAFTEDVLTLKSGRFRASIRCVINELMPVEPPQPAEWRPAPAGFIAALKMALPFVNDTGWNNGIRLYGNELTAVKNVAGIKIECPTLDLDPPINLPLAAAEFITAQDQPEAMAVHAGALVLRWADGRWLRAQLLAQGFPEHVDSIFAKAGDSLPVKIDADWRLAFADMLALGVDVFELTPTGLQAVRGAAATESIVQTKGLDDGHKSKWFTKSIAPVIDLAHSWNPGAYPNAAGFKGQGCSGLVMGVR